MKKGIPHMHWCGVCGFLWECDWRVCMSVGCGHCRDCVAQIAA